MRFQLAGTFSWSLQDQPRGREHPGGTDSMEVRKPSSRPSGGIHLFLSTPLCVFPHRWRMRVGVGDLEALWFTVSVACRVLSRLQAPQGVFVATIDSTSKPKEGGGKARKHGDWSINEQGRGWGKEAEKANNVPVTEPTMTNSQKGVSAGCLQGGLGGTTFNLHRAP